MTTDKSEPQQGEVAVVPTGGCYDCGGRCVLKIHVKDGVAIRVDTDDGDLKELRQKFGDGKHAPGFEYAATVVPSIVIKAKKR